MKFMGESWKSWKSHLVKTYIRNKPESDKSNKPESDKPKAKSPVDIWNISQSQWEDFCRQETSKKFQANYFLFY